MARIEIHLPSLLQQRFKAASSIEVEADTLAQGFVELRTSMPELAVHLFDEQGELREHVLCFHNGVNSRWVDAATVKLADGDELLVMQAVSGG